MHTKKSRNSVGMRRWTAIEFRIEIEIFETVAKWDGESPSQLEVKSKFSKHWRNEMANRLRNSKQYRLRMKFETVSKCDGDPPSNFEVKSKFSKQWRNETANRPRNSKQNRLWMKVETVSKCDGEPPSNFEVKSKFSKQWWNETTNRLRISEWNRSFRNGVEIRRRIAFENRGENECITNFETVAHFAVASPSKCEIAKFRAKFFPLGLEHF